MANISYATDDALMDLERGIRRMLDRFMEDNHLDADEHAIYTVLNTVHRTFAMDRAIERATEHLRKNPQQVSTYGRKLLHDAGLQPIDLDAHRTARTVIPFPGRRNDAS